MSLTDRLVEDRWVKCGPSAMDNRLDALRHRADFLLQKIRAGHGAPRGRDELEYAALMWAIAELSGIGDEVRARAAEREEKKAANANALTRRAAHFESLYTSATLKNAALKTRCQLLCDELHRLRPAGDTTKAEG